MSGAAISVIADPVSALTFDVVVRDASGESRHRVTIETGDAARWARLGAAPARCVEAAMRFLLDREPKESILGAFDISLIRRYFPGFDDALPGYLARPGARGRSA
jgi:hypothetical protein